VVLPWDHTPVLWDHTGRFCGTNRGARTKPVVPAWSPVSHGKAGLWDHGGPSPLSWARSQAWSWDHDNRGPPMVPRTTAPGRPRAQRRGIGYGLGVRAHGRSRKVTVARPAVVIAPLTGS